MLLKTFKFVIDKHIKVIFKLSFVQVNFIDLSWDAFKSNWLQDSSVQRIFLNSFNKTYFKFNILALHYTVHCTVNSLKFLVLHYHPPPFFPPSMLCDFVETTIIVFVIIRNLPNSSIHNTGRG